MINVIEYIISTVGNYAKRKAVVEGDRTIDFETLGSRSKFVATKIIEVKDQTNKPIAVFLPKSIESVIANIAITNSGNFYMNLDIKSPDSRVSNILEKIKPEIIVTNNANEKKLRAIIGEKDITILNIDEVSIEGSVDETALLNRLENLIDTDPYCIINTSGSTGTPKGVVLNHKSFIDFTEWAIETLKITDDEVIGSLSPLYFDIYSFELCLLLSKGATIVIVPENLAVFPAKIVEFLAMNKINFIFWVPTIMVNIANLNIFSSFKLPDLKKILFAGEVFPTKHLNYWRKYIPHATYINLYGPIEITLDCTYYIVDKELSNDTPIPIGRACKNTDVLVLNDDEQPAEINQKGELCVRGTSLAMGYYNDPEKTAKAFVQNPLNNNYPELIYRTGDVVYKNEEGDIIFVGRKDFQVKHLGYRIDLSEVEHVIVNTWGKIKNACVLYHHGKKEIWMIYEGADEISASEFRKDLLAYLPKYMLPTQLKLFAELPRNPNGKIDRNLLATLISDEASN